MYTVRKNKKTKKGAIISEREHYCTTATEYSVLRTTTYVTTDFDTASCSRMIAGIGFGGS